MDDVIFSYPMLLLLWELDHIFKTVSSKLGTYIIIYI